VKTYAPAIHTCKATSAKRQMLFVIGA